MSKQRQVGAGVGVGCASASAGLEPLEPRVLMSVVPVGAQPDGNLSGKIVYLHAGHGWTANSNGTWSTQRGETNEIVEDFGNHDQMTYLADYLFRSGATVVPLRPVGNQLNEVLLDNTDATFTGSWSVSTSTTYWTRNDAVSTQPFRFANSSTTETATARYRPTIAQAGYYPVYTWAVDGNNRTKQLYRVTHAGGSTEVTVDHRRVGKGYVYLGTYYFNQGTAGYVDISNKSSTAGVVIADHIRFGNGMGDQTPFGTTSGRSREDEAGLYWFNHQAANARGVTSANYGTGTVSSPPAMAAFMNNQNVGTLSDRVFYSIHSNAANTTARGTISLLNGNNTPSSRTPNQFTLADLTAREVAGDLIAQNGRFEHNWASRASFVYDEPGFEYGEISNSVINNEFDATIIEVAFHDNVQDAQLMRDPKVRDAVAKASYQGLARYFRAVDTTTSLTMLPGSVTGLRATPGSASGSVTLNWQAPLSNSWNGDAPTGYRVYTSTDGRGFDGGTLVAGGTTTAFTMTGLDPAQLYFFKVAAVNTGGESATPDTVAATAITRASSALFVNGFDRNDRTLNFKQPYPLTNSTNTVERVLPRFGNRGDFVVEHARALFAAAPTAVSISTAQNEQVIAGNVSLAPQSAVFWMLGEESSADATFSTAEQTLVSNYLAGGGKLFVSGTEVGFDLDAQNNGRTFYNNTLRADYVADDANTYNASGVVGSIFSGISLSFDNRANGYDPDFPDVITPLGGANSAFTYVGGTGGTAAITYAGAGADRLIMLAFPFESIVDDADRVAIMQAAVTFFSLDQSVTNIQRVVDNADPAPAFTSTGGWIADNSNGINGSRLFAPAGTANTSADFTFFVPVAGVYNIEVYLPGSSTLGQARYTMSTAAGPVSVTVSQASATAGWVTILNVNLAERNQTLTLDAAQSTGGLILADAARISGSFTNLKPGDADRDGDVDFADLAKTRVSFTGPLTPGSAPLRSWSQGDFDLDGDVDNSDYMLVITHYTGSLTPAPAPAPTTEPIADSATATATAGNTSNTPRASQQAAQQTPRQRRQAAPLSTFRVARATTSPLLDASSDDNDTRRTRRIR